MLVIMVDKQLKTDMLVVCCKVELEESKEDVDEKNKRFESRACECSRAELKK